MKFVVVTMLCFVMAVVFPSNAAPKKIVVPKDYKSIQKALDEAEEGDTVFVLRGTYKESIVMKDYVDLIGEDPATTILSGNRGKPVVEGANHAAIKNFTVINGSKGILCKNTNPVIEHCIIRDNRTGIHALISLPQIKNNIIFSNEWSGIYCELIATSQRTSIDHNFIGENGYCGIMLAHRSEVLIQNTLLYQNKQYGIYVNEDSKKSRIVYNNFYLNRSAYNSFAVINETNISKDPGFAANPKGGYSFSDFGRNNPALTGLGVAGGDIGPMSDAALLKVRIDSDKDGIPDDVDQCPDMPEDKDGFQDEDGCPDFDNDNDGIYDPQDRCPDAPEDFDGFEDSDGCPDLDNDKDGITDQFDKCPNTPEDRNGVADDDGCPDGGVAPAAKQNIPQGMAPEQKVPPVVPAITDTTKKVQPGSVPVKK